MRFQKFERKSGSTGFVKLRDNMTRNQAEQIARIIYNVFEHEESIDPRTIAIMFQYMGRLDREGTHPLITPQEESLND